DKFWNDGAVTISRIERAKGNEAVMVYVVGIEEIAKNENSVSERNKLFTAMTRAKCFLKVMAVADREYTLYEEIEKSIEANGRFKFKFIRPKNTADDNES
ncbi:MAG: ATP-binding domain-containing protein, partial [Sarcina sp.]